MPSADEREQRDARRRRRGNITIGVGIAISLSLTILFVVSPQAELGVAGMIATAALPLFFAFVWGFGDRTIADIGQVSPEDLARMTDERGPGEERHLHTNFEFVVPSLSVTVLIGCGVVLGLAVQNDEVGDVLTAVIVIAGATLTFGMAWIVSRASGNRRFSFLDDGVWLPAAGLRLRGCFVPYVNVTEVELYSHANRRVRIRFAGGTRRFDHHFVDVGDVRKKLKKRVKRAKRAAKKGEAQR